MDLDISEWNKETLEFIISESCEKDISVNVVISNILEKVLSNNPKNINEEIQ